jgi:uncharacterized protein YceH (UPF0502 family)
VEEDSSPALAAVRTPLEERVATLERELDQLKQQFENLRRQFE